MDVRKEALDALQKAADGKKISLYKAFKLAEMRVASLYDWRAGRAMPETESLQRLHDTIDAYKPSIKGRKS